MAIKFPDNKTNIVCSLENLSSSPPPPLPGGYNLLEKVYFLGMTKQLAEGDRLVQGDQGEVMGPTQAGEKQTINQILVQQAQRRSPLDVLSRTKPQILWEGDKDEFDRLASGNPSSSSRVDELKARRRQEEDDEPEARAGGADGGAGGGG